MKDKVSPSQRKAKRRFLVSRPPQSPSPDPHRKEPLFKKIVKIAKDANKPLEKEEITKSEPSLS